MARSDGIRTATQARKRIPLNNNNNRNNNRRRGRNNRGGQGGGSQGNRIDSRARGNAPQMLEKYKKLAHDASLNGDRVQTEYYLQFADHYFRVIADTRTQRDEQRPRRDDREPDDFSEDGNEFEDNSSSRGRDSRDFRDADENEDVRRGSEGEEASQEDEGNPFVPDSRPSRNKRSRNDGVGNSRASSSPATRRAAADSTRQACHRRSARTAIRPKNKFVRGDGRAGPAQRATTRRSKRSADSLVYDARG